MKLLIASRSTNRYGQKGVCDDCKKYDVLTGLVGVCTTCLAEKINGVGVFCEVCYKQEKAALSNAYQGDRFWIGINRSEEGECTHCQKERILNSDGICSNCFEHLSTECVVCNKMFSMKDIYQTHCRSCQPECLHCKEKFTPNAKTDRYCKKCYESVAADECLICHEKATLNTLGYCENCNRESYVWESSDIIPTFTCGVCRTVEVRFPEGICLNCAYATAPCPHCKNPMPADMYLCNECLETNYGQS